MDRFKGLVPPPPPMGPGIGYPAPMGNPLIASVTQPQGPINREAFGNILPKPSGNYGIASALTEQPEPMMEQPQAQQPGIDPTSAMMMGSFANQPQPDPQVQEMNRRLMMQHGDRMLAGGLTKEENNDAKALRFFQNIVAPSMAAFGGTGTSAAGIQLLQQVQGEISQHKQEARQRHTDDVAALKIFNELARIPNKEFQEQFKQILAAAKLRATQQNDLANQEIRRGRNVIAARKVDNAEKMTTSNIDKNTAAIANLNAKTTETKEMLPLKKEESQAKAGNLKSLKDDRNRQTQGKIDLRSEQTKLTKARTASEPIKAEAALTSAKNSGQAKPQPPEKEEETKADTAKKRQEAIAKAETNRNLAKKLLESPSPELRDRGARLLQQVDEAETPAEPKGGWTKETLMAQPAATRLKIIQMLKKRRGK